MLEFTSYKEACLYGYKKGFHDGLEKGIDMSNWWSDTECPPSNSSPIMLESIPLSNTSPEQ